MEKEEPLMIHYQFQPMMISKKNRRSTSSKKLPTKTIPRSEEHTSELQSHQYLHSFPTRRSSDLKRRAVNDSLSVSAYDDFKEESKKYLIEKITYKNYS